MICSLRSLVLAILMLSLLGYVPACSSCPAPLPPRVVTVHLRCMQPPPSSLPSLSWPDPNADGTTTLTLVQTRALLLLLTTVENYVAEQYAACGQTGDAGP